jgi:hypothetical protein
MSEQRKVKVCGAMSLPRVTWSDNMFCATQAFAKARIPLWSYTGAYWHKGIAKMFTRAIEREVDYLITLDYDTTFTSEDMNALLRLAVFNPDVAAVFPVQYKRDSDQIICAKRNGDGEYMHTTKTGELDADLVDADAGHFGLSVFNINLIKQVPQPWFMCIPNKWGCWGDEQLGDVDPFWAEAYSRMNGGRSGNASIDADVFFWTRMRDAGLRCCLAPRVSVGHLEVIQTVPDANLQKSDAGLPETYTEPEPSELAT